MCVFGEPIHVEDAQRLGIIDRISDGDLLADAIALAREAIGRAPRRTRDAADKLGTPESNALLFATYQERVRKTRKNLLAPLAAIDAVVAATQLPFPDGCHKERELFERLLVSSQAKAFIHVFLAERAATKSARATATSPPRPLQSAAVIGAGTMGRGIAMCLANAGVPVRVKETSAERLDAAMEAVHATYQSAVRKGRMSEADMRSRVSQIHPQLDDTGLDAVDLAIEAAFENLGVKRAVFAELSALTKPTAILATNTSYLNIDEIATACARPGMTLGLHFFSPAHVMRLLEIVPGKATTPSATATAFAYAKRLGKLAILAGNGPGFIGNRMLRVYRRQAQWLLEEGASPREVDVALEAWGMAMGPFTAQDLAGIDIAMGSRHVFVDVDTREGDDPRVIDVLYARGRLGQKTGAGWYRYDETRVPLPDPDVGACIEEVARARGITRRSVPPEEIVERTIFALVNEGARILEEGHALRASDIDLVYINGFGFPAYRGGPMHYADEVGLPVVYTRLVELQTLHGSQWEPSPLLTRLAETGGSFEEWDNRDVNVDQSIVSQSRP
jgi:3-hydroxyacyl-CoA dehydrogenase